MNKKGFTLVELMAVLILLAVIITISTTSILTARDKANASGDKNKKILIETACENYLRDSGRESSDTSNITIEKLINENYLKDDFLEYSSKTIIVEYKNNGFKCTFNW